MVEEVSKHARCGRWFHLIAVGLRKRTKSGGGRGALALALSLALIFEGSLSLYTSPKAR